MARAQRGSGCYSWSGCFTSDGRSANSSWRVPCVPGDHLLQMQSQELRAALRAHAPNTHSPHQQHNSDNNNHPQRLSLTPGHCEKASKTTSTAMLFSELTDKQISTGLMRKTSYINTNVWCFTSHLSTTEKYCRGKKMQLETRCYPETLFIAWFKTICF